MVRGSAVWAVASNCRLLPPHSSILNYPWGVGSRESEVGEQNGGIIGRTEELRGESESGGAKTKEKTKARKSYGTLVPTQDQHYYRL